MKSQVYQGPLPKVIKINAKLEREVEEAIAKLPNGKFNAKANEIEAAIRAKYPD